MVQERALRQGHSGTSRVAVDPERLKALIATYGSSRDLPPGCSVIHERSKDRGALLRVGSESPASAGSAESGSLIVKFWLARNFGERCKQLAGLSNGRREWRSHRYLYAQGLALPEPMAYLNWSAGKARIEAFAAEDLGPTTQALKLLKAAVRLDDAAEVARIEAAVIALTRTMVAAGVTDVDHQLRNIVLTPDGRMFRLDVECAKRWLLGRIPDAALGVMIGRLITSHAYACQPQLNWTEDFARRLASALSPSRSVLRYAQKEIDTLMARQQARQGIDSRLSLAW